MSNQKQTLDELISTLKEHHNLSETSISLLKDKGLKEEDKDDDFSRLLAIMEIPSESFQARRARINRSWIEKMLNEGDAPEITTGRYGREVGNFNDISSEQALVQGRLEFGVEYIISLADNVKELGDQKIIGNPFTDDEKQNLRSIYKEFSTKDYLGVKLIEKRTNHDIVAANTWLVIRAQQLGLDANMMRGIVHFGRTSEDVNTNVMGRLYTKALGKWTGILAKLVDLLQKKAGEYMETTCIARTHGQDAQLTTLGHIYANLAKQIERHAGPLIKEAPHLLDGKIAGAIGTDVDMKAALPQFNPQAMYRHIVEDIFGLKYEALGNDQDSSNAAFCVMFDTMVNVGFEIQKAAQDTWLYASHGMLKGKSKKGESGSSIMAQKVNPFFAEGAEALVEIISSVITPIKKMLVSYREQGDLRRSITKREGYHPIMLSIIAMERLITEINRWEPDIVSIEAGVYETGPKITSSAIQMYLRAQGVSQAYDEIKDIVEKPHVKPNEVEEYIGGLATRSIITSAAATHVTSMLHSVMDTQGYMQKLSGKTGEKDQDAENEREAIAGLAIANRSESRKKLLGNAIQDTRAIIEDVKSVLPLLKRYEKEYAA